MERMPGNPDGQRAAVIYLRQSLDRYGNELAITRQREDGEKLAAGRGYTITAVHTDNDTSASGKVRRPGFEAALDDITSGRASVIIAWSLDRLTRNATDRLRLIQAGRKAKAVIAVVRGSDLDLSTPSGRLSADILASVAEAEIEIKADRQRRANEQAARAGRRVGGRRPFGYEQDGKTLRPGEAAAVRDGYHAYLMGTPLAAIARDWNTRGFRAQRAPWRPDNVAMVLRNPRYMGWRGYAPADPDRHGRPKIEAVARAEWPAIVDEGIWRTVNGMLDKAAATTVHGGARLLLTGVARCGICAAEGADKDGRDITVWGGASKYKYPSYRCRRVYGHIGRKAEPVDEWVSEHVIAYLSRPGIRSRLLTDESRPDAAAARREYEAAVQDRKNKIRDLTGVLSVAEFRDWDRQYQERLAGLRKLMEDSSSAAALGPLATAEDVRATWKAMLREHQRAAIDRLVTVTIYPAGRGTRTFRPETVIVEPKR